MSRRNFQERTHSIHPQYASIEPTCLQDLPLLAKRSAKRSKDGERNGVRLHRSRLIAYLSQFWTAEVSKFSHRPRGRRDVQGTKSDVQCVSASGSKERWGSCDELAPSVSSPSRVREVRAPASHEVEGELVADKKGIDGQERHHERGLPMMKQTQRSRDVVSKSRTENRGGGGRIR